MEFPRLLLQEERDQVTIRSYIIVNPSSALKSFYLLSHILALCDLNGVFSSPKIPASVTAGRSKIPNVLGSVLSYRLEDVITHTL